MKPNGFVPASLPPTKLHPQFLFPTRFRLSLNYISVGTSPSWLYITLTWGNLTNSGHVGLLTPEILI